MAQSYDEWKKSQGGGNSPQNSGSSGNEGASGVISYDEWKKSGSPQRYDGYSREIDSFAQDANNFFRMAQRDNSGEKRFNAADYFEERKKQADALKQRAANISRYLEDNANLYTPDYYDSLMQTLSTFDTEVDDVLSSYKPSLDAREGMRAYEDEFIAAQERNERLKGLNKQVMFGADSTSPGYGMLERFYQYDTDNSYRGVTDNWTDKERYTLGQLQKEDPAKARDYATQVNNYYNAQSTEATRENIRQNAVANKGKSTAAALLASTFTAPGELADRLAENMARGTTTEKRYVTPTDYAQEITGAISQDLNQKYGTFDADEARRIRAELQNNVQGLVDNTGSGMNVATGRTGEFVYDMLDDKGRGDLYQVGYSIAQNALSRYTLGAMGGEAAVLANYFMNAATSGIDDARRAGASGNQAMLSGIVKGALEVATEVAPLDRLFKMGDAVTWGELFKNLGMEALLEAIGEGTNTALGYLADQKILGDASEYNRMVQEYVNQGMTEAQAKQRAFRDAAMNTAYDALTGAVSGIVSGGTETVGKTAQANLAYRNVDPRTLVDMGMGTAEGSKAYTMAQQMQEQLDNDQKISGNQKRVLAQNIQLQKTAQEKTETEAGEAASTFSRATEQPKVSKDGRAIQISTDNPVDVLDFASMDNGVATVQLNDGETAAYDDIAFKDQQQANQFYAVRSLPGLDTESANNLLHTIQDADAGKDIDSVVGIREAYAMGYYNQDAEQMDNTEAAVLSPELRQAVYDMGVERQKVQEGVKQTKRGVTARATQGYKKVIIEGKLSRGDYKTRSKRNAELKYIDKIADIFAGTMVHVYESFKDKDGKYYYKDSNGVKHEAPNGKYINGEIWLDINSGDNGEGMMLNTFAHEMYHHIEKFNKEKANELASFVSRELGIENVEAAVQDQITKARAAGYGEDYFKNRGMNDVQAANEVYSRAMSDFVADSLETMFTRGNPAEAIARLKNENRTLFDEIKAFIDKWVSKVKKFYSDKTISQEGAVVAQLEKFEQLQQLFMEAMQGAGENYLAAEVADEKSVPREKYEKFSFAGRESATADKSALQQAEELAQKGVPNETIRKQTGWYKGIDGKWRYEIDDSQMEITDDIINYMSLGELMQHEKLYAAYPDLADISVVFQGLDKGVNGAYNAQFDSINLSYRLKNDPVGLKDALVHEIQHAIQHREGFTSGATVGQWERKIKAGFDSRRAADIRKAQDTEMELRRIQNEEPEFYRDMMELDAMTPDLPRGEVDWETLEKISDDPIEWQQYDARREELEAKYGDTKVWDMNDLLYQREQAAKNVGRSGVELYFDTAGEIEARDASNRRSKSPEQRKSSPPILGNEDTVFAEGNANETEKFSLRNEKPATAREILSQIDPSKRNETERYFLGQYQDRLKKISEEEPRLAAIKKQMESLDPKKDKAKLSELRIEAGKIQRNVTYLKKKVRESEGFDMFKRMAKEERNNRSVQKYKEEQKQKIKAMHEEQRVLRNELTGTTKMVNSMEDEFIQLAKDYEAKKIDLKTMEEKYLDAGKQYSKDTEMWEREFSRLMKLYDDLSAKYSKDAGDAKKKIKRLEDTILRQRQTAKERVAGRRNTEMRHKIQKKVNELDQLLRHGSKHRNVPEFLQDSVAAVLQAINMEVRDGDQRRKTFEATLARYDRQIAMTSDPDKVSELIRKRNEYEAKGDQFANRMEMLQAAYKQIREENTGMELDEGIAGKLDSLFEVVGNTPLGQMNAAQLEAVNDILNVTQATIRNANELLAEERSAGVVENSKDAIREIRSMGDTKKKKTRIRKDLEKFGWNNLKPIYVFDVIGSKTLTNLYNALRGGEDTLATDLHEAKSFFQEQWKKNNGKEWDMDQKWKFTSTSGKEFELDLNQIMTLYAMAKDEDARSHLRVGGFSFDSDYQTEENVNIGKVSIPVKMESTDASAYNLSDEILGEIISKLTPQQRAFADAMQAYLSDVMAAKGNEVSLKKYGIRLFKKKNYFPIRVADQFMAKAREQRNGDRKLKDSGFTKERKPQAKNPVVLSAFTEIWAEHVDEMSLYHSFVLPLDDFNRVLNYHDMFVEGQDAVSVVEAITNAFGKGATNYIDQLIKDVNGGIRGGSTVSFANSLVSKAKKAQTMASLSVAIQQPSSIIRAMSMIDSRYFIGHRVTEKTHNRTWDEIKQYAPIAYIKEMGGYDTNVGKSTVDYLTDTADYETFMEKFGALFTDEKFRDDALGRLPALMDEMSWGVIWNAVKREQSAQHPNMDVNSKAFMNLVADRFTDVITRTQVYDSVFSRSGLMRDKNDLAKVITSFMAEPTTTANMLAVAVLQAKRGDISKAQIAKTTAAIVASLALNAALVSTVYALRDDDEDKRYDEKWMENFRNNFFESLNPAGYIPYVRDIYNVFVKGYDVERADMELFGDLQNALDGLKNDDISAWDKTSAVIGSIGNLLGVPVKNILRDVKGIVQTAGFAWDDKPNPRTKTGAYMARRGMDLNNGEEMILALQRGDMEHIQRVFGRYESQEKAESALQSAIGEKYRAGEMSAEEATQLLTDYFEREDEHEVYWLFDKWDYARDNGSSEGWKKYGKFLEGIESGDFQSEMERLLEHGAEASDIQSQITRTYRKKYLENPDDREEIREKLQTVYKATGMHEDDILEKFKDWDFEAEYGMTYSNFKAEYREGNVTEAELRSAMDFYGLYNYEIEEGIRGLNEEIKFFNKYGMSISEMRDAYDNGDISENQLINALVFTGKTRTEAREEVNERNIEKKYGIGYAKLDDAYKYNDISRSEFYNAMREHGATQQEADEAILGYDWLKKNVRKYPDLTIGDAKRFVIKVSDKMEERTLTDYGVSIDAYLKYKEGAKDCPGVDADGDGQIDAYSKAKQLFAMIDKLPISDEAKDGLALITNANSTLRKYAPWHKK